jgi:hypothetical protein
VVAGACADDAVFELVGGQGDHHIIGTSKLIGAYDLEVFAFQEDLAIVFSGQALIVGEGGTVDDLAEPACGGMKVEAPARPTRLLAGGDIRLGDGFGCMIS